MVEKTEKPRKTRIHVTGKTCTICDATVKEALEETREVEPAGSILPGREGRRL